MIEIIAQRQFSTTYIYLDIVFLCVFCFLLLIKRKYATVIVGLLAGILYMIVDFGIFHLLTHSRSISEGHSMFWVLLWMSMSYGFTNFTWIWLWISKDKNLLQYTTLILLWWFACPLLVKLFGNPNNMIVISRTTNQYHSYMAVILFLGYLSIIIYNLIVKDKKYQFHLLWMLAIGVLVQFGWESALLIGGIRSTLITSFEAKMMTLLVNSLLETNLGIPIIYPLFLLYSRKYTERLQKRKDVLTFKEAICENNELKVKRNVETSEYYR